MLMGLILTNHFFGKKGPTIYWAFIGLKFKNSSIFATYMGPNTEGKLKPIKVMLY